MDQLAKGTKSIKFCHENAVFESHRSETLYEIAGRPWLLRDRVAEVRNIMCRKCRAFERASCGVCHGGLCCSCTASYPVRTGGSAVRHDTRKTATMRYT